MTPEPEELLREAVQLHQSSQFKKGLDAAEKARKKFLKDGNTVRATEALRVMGDCAVNMHDHKLARSLYAQLLNEAITRNLLFYQAAASWGLGQVSLHQMDYKEASKSFNAGLSSAKQTADNWYTGWNAFGLAIAYRGMGELATAKPLLKEAIEAFRVINQPTIEKWVERVLTEIGGATPPDRASKVWLCPMCGSKLRSDQAASLKKGQTVTCEYCGTSVG
jgi:tetratricopeptide (TPR) repeat protein